MRIGEALILVPEQNRFRLLCESTGSVLARRSITAADLLTTLPDARERVFRRRYRDTGGRLKPGKAGQAALSPQQRVRLFLDSNVLTAGIVATWGLEKAVLSLCAARICRLVLAEVVRDEVEDNFLRRLEGMAEPGEVSSMLRDYTRLIGRMKPEIPYPSRAVILAARHLIRHEADVPVWLSAIASRPDWFLTHNTKRFTPAVARRSALRIATPAELFRSLSRSISGEHPDMCRRDRIAERNRDARVRYLRFVPDSSGRT